MKKGNENIQMLLYVQHDKCKAFVLLLKITG